MDKKIKIGIIGGGSVGLFAANIIFSNEKSSSLLEVDIIEKNDRLGKKILATGNGRCNFTNAFLSKEKYNNQEFAQNVLEQFDGKMTLSQFEKMGLFYKFEEDGWGYPYSESASSLLAILMREVEKKAKIFLNSPVKKVDYKEDKVIVYFNNEVRKYDYLIISTGNIASNLAKETDNDFLHYLNLETRELKPSLVPLKTNKSYKKISGLRIKCQVSLYNDHLFVTKDEGEILFKEDGLSGIVIYQMSHHINRKRGKNYSLRIDFLPNISYENIRDFLVEKKEWSLNDVFLGLLNKKILDYLFEEIQIYDLSKKIKEFSKNDLLKIMMLLKEYQVNIVGTYGFEFAQVASGGIKLSQLNNKLQLVRYPRIFMGGEILDIDGLCGGYNLQFAWSCGGIIGQEILQLANKLEKQV